MNPRSANSSAPMPMPGSITRRTRSPPRPGALRRTRSMGASVEGASSLRRFDGVANSTAAAAEHRREEKAQESAYGDRHADIVQNRNAREGQDAEAENGAEIGENERSNRPLAMGVVVIQPLEEQTVV